MMIQIKKLGKGQYLSKYKPDKDGHKVLFSGKTFIHTRINKITCNLNQKIV